MMEIGDVGGSHRGSMKKKMSEKAEQHKRTFDACKPFLAITHPN